MLLDNISATSMILASPLVMRPEKTYTGIERAQSFSVQHKLTKLAELEVAKAPVLDSKKRQMIIKALNLHCLSLFHL